MNIQCGGQILRRSRDGGLRRCRQRSTCRSLRQSTFRSPRRCIGRYITWKRMRLRWSKGGHNVVLFGTMSRPFRSRHHSQHLWEWPRDVALADFYVVCCDIARSAPTKIVCIIRVYMPSLFPPRDVLCRSTLRLSSRIVSLRTYFSAPSSRYTHCAQSYTSPIS